MTGIQWTDETWNPTTGCDRVSPGCDHCYAMTMAKRLKGMGQAKYQRDGDPKTSGPGFGLTVHPDALDLPLQWRKPRKVFVNCMSDLFHDDVPDDFIARVFDVMAQDAAAHVPDAHQAPRADAVTAVPRTSADGHVAGTTRGRPWPLPNVWLGVSAEDQHWADIRIPALIDTPAAVRFVSAEPLLGPIRLHRGLACCPVHDFTGGFCTGPCPDLVIPDWLIIGGESGPGARPMDLEWAYSLIRQCRRAGVAVFMKQVGSVAAAELGPFAGQGGGEWDAFPDDLRVREFPVTAEVVPS